MGADCTSFFNFGPGGIAHRRSQAATVLLVLHRILCFRAATLFKSVFPFSYLSICKTVSICLLTEAVSVE